MKTLSLIAILFTLNSHAASLKLTVNESATIDYVILETKEACAITVDPSWSHEEDTRYAKSVLDYSSYKKVKAIEEKGYQFIAMRNSKECSLEESNTFEYLRNPKPMDGFSDRVFYVATSGQRLAAVATQLKAYETVERIYIKDLKKFKAQVNAALINEVNSAVDSLK